MEEPPQLLLWKSEVNDDDSSSKNPFSVFANNWNSSNDFDIKRQEIEILFFIEQNFSRCSVGSSSHFGVCILRNEDEREFVLLEICCAISIHKVFLKDRSLYKTAKQMNRSEPFEFHHDVQFLTIFNLRQMMLKVNTDDDVSINSWCFTFLQDFSFTILPICYLSSSIEEGEKSL